MPSAQQLKQETEFEQMPVGIGYLGIKILLAISFGLNIGTAEKFYMFEGQRVWVGQPTTAKRLLTQVLKQGNPQDSLIAYVYHSDPHDPIWLPIGKDFISQPLNAEDIHDTKEHAISVFNFDPPVKLQRGVYNFVIYRTGNPDDKDYYQIDSGHFALQ